MIKTWTIKKVMAMAVVIISLVTVTGCTGDLNKIVEWVNARKSSVSEDQRIIPTANVAVRTSSDEHPVSSTEKKSSQVLTTQSEIPESSISKSKESNSAAEESAAPVSTADLTSADSSETSVSQESTTSTEWYQVTGEVVEGDGDARGIAVEAKTPEYFMISFYGSANEDESISNVRIAVWTEANGQDDIEWINAETRGISTKTYTIYAKNHNNETSGYIVHVYYTDGAGVEKVYYNPETISIADSSETSVSQESTTSTEWYQVTDDVIEGDGAARGIAVEAKTPEYFMISFYGSANDDVSISNVRIAVWTEANGQDDIEWIDAGTRGISTGTYTIYAKNHNNETSGYIVHVYYTDGAGVEKVYYNPETISISQ